MTPAALRHLRRVDPVMKRLLKEVGKCALEPEGKRSPFESLVRAVAHQQLHGNAARCILERFVALFPHGRFPTAAELAAVSDEALRGVGFSGSKVAAVRDIAEKTVSGVVPSPRKIVRLDDEEIIERLTSVRGVGRWTVEMLLIFQLGRPDVLPADDFGVRAGFRVAYGLPEMPRPKEVLAAGEIWRPFRTTAAWYLWRTADRAVEEKRAAASAEREAKSSYVV
jgi:DNA-3-methyladenine glycosylase II